MLKTLIVFYLSIHSLALATPWHFPNQKSNESVIIKNGEPKTWAIRNKVIHLEVKVKTDSEIKVFSFDAQMPEHAHGMLTSPKITRIAPKTYKIEGINLHMAGYWELYFRWNTATNPSVIAIPMTIP